MNAVLSVVGMAVAGAAGQQLSALHGTDHYNEHDVKEATGRFLDLIRHDLRVLRHADLLTAGDLLQSFHNSCEYSLSQQQQSSSSRPSATSVNAERLRTMRNHAAKSFRMGLDTTDRITAVSILIFADYHQVAFAALSANEQSGDAANNNNTNFDWTGGKHEAQNLMRQYMAELEPKLTHTAHEELGLKREIPFVSSARKRHQVLAAFGNLSAAVFCLAPLCENHRHPTFPLLERAVLAAMTRPDATAATTTTLWSTPVGHMLSEPKLRHSLFTNNNNNNASSSLIGCHVETGQVLIQSSDWKHQTMLQVWKLGSLQTEHGLKANSTTTSIQSCSFFEHGTKVMIQILSTTQGGGTSNAKANTSVVWDLRQGKEICRMQGSTRCCLALPQNQGGDVSAISNSCMDESYTIWNLSSGALVRTVHPCICAARHHAPAVGLRQNMVGFLQRRWDGAVVPKCTCTKHLYAVYQDKADGETKILHGGGENLLVSNCFYSNDGSEKPTDDGNNNNNNLPSQQQQDDSSMKTKKIYSSCGASIVCVEVLLEGNTGTSSRAIVGSTDGSVMIFNLWKGTKLHSLKATTPFVQMQKTYLGQTQTPWWVLLDNYQSKLMAASADHTMTVWDIATGQPRVRLSGHQHPITCMTVFPNTDYATLQHQHQHQHQQQAVSGDLEGNVKLWDLSTGTELFSLQHHHNTNQAQVAIVNLAVVEQATKLLTSCSSSVAVWDLPHASRRMMVEAKPKTQSSLLQKLRMSSRTFSTDQ